MKSSKIAINASKNKQFELFSSASDFSANNLRKKNLYLSKESILLWRQKIYKHQQLILDTLDYGYVQKSMIKDQLKLEIFKVNPFLLNCSSINFWRSSKPINNGPAIYFVIDTINKQQIILYIGETHSADKRWKGEHDCKNYVNNYIESLSKHEIESHIDIRFSLDVPSEVKFRRKLEQKLICLWLPPFNKETRGRWSTTFTNY